MKRGLTRRFLSRTFPTFPYPLSHDIEAVLRLPIGDAVKRDILHDNAETLLGLLATSG